MVLKLGKSRAERSSDMARHIYRGFIIGISVGWFLTYYWPDKTWLVVAVMIAAFAIQQFFTK